MRNLKTLISNECKNMFKNTCAIKKISYLALAGKSVNFTLIKIG